MPMTSLRHCCISGTGRGTLAEYLSLLRRKDRLSIVDNAVRLGTLQEEAVTSGREYWCNWGKDFALAKRFASMVTARTKRGCRWPETRVSPFEGSKLSWQSGLRDQGRHGQHYDGHSMPRGASSRGHVNLTKISKFAEIAGEHWPERQLPCWSTFVTRNRNYPQGQVDIFMHEG